MTDTLSDDMQKNIDMQIAHAIEVDIEAVGNDLTRHGIEAKVSSKMNKAKNGFMWFIDVEFKDREDLLLYRLVGQYDECCYVNLKVRNDVE